MIQKRRPCNLYRFCNQYKRSECDNSNFDTENCDKYLIVKSNTQADKHIIPRRARAA